MRLYSRSLGGAGKAIVILHGLFGSSRNWVAAGRFLAAYGAVTAVDLRNHGESPHDPSHTLEDMTGDLRQWLSEHAPGQAAVIVGHSMGGHVAMALALAHPEEVAGLVVVDIAPRAYSGNHAAELAALSLDVSRLGSRAEVDAAMAAHVADPALRRFLQSNLERSDTRSGAGWRASCGPESRSGPLVRPGFRWRLNVEALRRCAPPPEFHGSYPGPALFVAAGRSAHVTDADHALIRSLFPAASIRVIDGADHWVHVSAPEAFRGEVEAFLAGLGEGPPEQRASSPADNRRGGSPGERWGEAGEEQRG